MKTFLLQKTYLNRITSICGISSGRRPCRRSPKFLIKFGADVNCLITPRHTILDLAYYSRMKELLIDSGVLTYKELCEKNNLESAKMSQSIGIEVVGKANNLQKMPIDKKYSQITSYTASWDIPTRAQKDSIKNLIEILKKEYNLTNNDIYEHDDISPQKTRGEAKDLYEKN